MLSSLQSAQTVIRGITRMLRGQAVTLYDKDGSISAEIPDAIVTVDAGVVGSIGGGAAEIRATLRLQARWRDSAVASLTAEAKGHRWDVVHVGPALQDGFRVELLRYEEQHTNRFDLEGNQAVWHE